jgi:uncharacterized protein YuzB (UPF0349 family)
MPTPTVEYCLRNVDAATRRRLRDVGGVETVEKRCLQRCGDCYRDDFLVVDGDRETGDSHAGILDALVEGDS